MLYELTSLACPLLSVGQAAEGAYAWSRDGDARGQVLGCWRTEIGTLGRILMLREFETSQDIDAERSRTLLSSNPFNAGNVVTELEVKRYRPFPFLPPIRIGDRGGIYEFRTYWLKPSGLAPTLAGWKDAIGPAREYTDHLVINMYAVDGAPHITHIWGFASLQQRSDLRARAYGRDVWPPKGGPEQILHATSTIALPQGASPLA